MPPHPNPQNLKPIKKGQVLNPDGRKGKNGKKGFSILGAFRNQINNEMDPMDFKMILNGLCDKAKAGDTKAIELLIKINNEKIEADNNNAQFNGPTLIIHMPKKDEPSDIDPSE